MINLWPLLLPAAAYSGWWVARRHYSKGKPPEGLSREYVVGLNYLLDEQPDKAVDVFIKLLEVDSDTVETHLALGSLFRRRGEVDRAIRIHQNLIARSQLSLLQRKEAMMALGQDYMSAGVFDRAEKIFNEIVELGGNREIACLHSLLAIYQQEKSWGKALDVILKLESSGSKMCSQKAHYYCEMANEALKAKWFDKAHHWVNQALQTDQQSVRASLIQAELDIATQQYPKAIEALKRIPMQDPEFLIETLEPLILCYQALNTMNECVEYLKHTLVDHPRTSVIFAIGEYLRQEEDIDYAIDFVSSQLSRCPSIRGLNRLIYWHLDSTYGKVQEKLHMLYNVTSKFLDNKPVYRCGHCGFSGKLLHWHCPSCKQWGSIKPIQGLEGD